MLVSAVIADAGNFQVTAIAKISAAAGGTRIVLTAMPPNTDALTILPSRNAGTDFVDDARYLVSWNTRVLNSGPRAFFCENVTAADATGLYLDPHVSRARSGISRSTIWKSAPGLGTCAAFIGLLPIEFSTANV